MLMQHRYMLDLMTTMEGGVCAKIETTCYTYISANDADNGTLTEAIQTLHTLQKKIVDEGCPQRVVLRVVYLDTILDVRTI